MVIQEPHSLFYPFFQALVKNPAPLHRKKNSFDIFFHFYQIPSITNESVVLDWRTTTIPFYSQAEKRKQLADGILSSKSNARMNNLDGSTPHLVVSKIMGMNAFLALGYAVPETTRGEESSLTGSVGILLMAFLLAIFIAQATATFLTRPIPGFVEAFQKTANGNFSWEIERADHDEFGELADSLNRMATGLREKERMSRLVSEDVLKVVALDDDSGIKPGGQRVEATILFSDIRGFTTLTEQHPPEEIVTMLNGYFSVMARCIRDHQGVLDKFIGDAIQAVFYPREGFDHQAIRACQAALAMREALTEYNQRRENQGQFFVQSGIGLSSGVVVSGCVGSSRGRLDYMVIGRTLQIATKLETASKKATSTGIMADPLTVRAAGSRIRFGFLERMELESGTRSVPVYELLNVRA